MPRSPLCGCSKERQAKELFLLIVCSNNKRLPQGKNNYIRFTTTRRMRLFTFQVALGVRL